MDENRFCHSLRGLCGLKYGKGKDICGNDHWSQPARAVWIEIYVYGSYEYCLQSQPARAVWIEIQTVPGCWQSQQSSQPARAVWIEILLNGKYINFPDSHSLRGLCGLK